MAEHLHSGPAELGAPMDYVEHERTYAAFIALAKVGTLTAINCLLALAIYAYGGAWGLWLGTILLILTVFAAVLGVVSRGSMRALVGVAVLGLLILALTAG